MFLEAISAHGSFTLIYDKIRYTRRKFLHRWHIIHNICTLFFNMGAYLIKWEFISFAELNLRLLISMRDLWTYVRFICGKIAK